MMNDSSLYNHNGRFLGSRLVDAYFLGGLAFSLILFQEPLIALAHLAIEDERYSYIAAVPFISAFLIWLKRDQVRLNANSSLWLIPLLLLSLLAGGASLLFMEASELGIPLAVQVFFLILVWMALGSWCYGIASLRTVLFPVLFLLLLIPIPESLMGAAAAGLQRGSAEVSELLFRLIGMPFSRDGFTFALPGVNVVVAEQCSGIRSTVSMLITAILTGYLFLKSGWSRLGFALLTIPVVVVKNAVRIVTISWLGVRVDPGYFTGDLHHYGGLPFTLLVLMIMLPVLWALHKIEKRRASVA